jgi:hypothetical protein
MSVEPHANIKRAIPETLSEFLKQGLSGLSHKLPGDVL